MPDPDLHVLTRTLPNARRGKAAALNDAYRYLIGSVLTEPRYAKWSHERVIVGVIDADGRLDPRAPAAVARHFSSRRIGGVQTLVRIYNRRGYLTWAQDVEFSVFGTLFQSGRTWWGTANMGSNGQFNRLSALADVADDTGPWRDRLTEDQNLGVRLIHQGWRSAQENSVTIDQQGLHSIRRLYRQRTRWAQGAWQALSLLGGVRRARVGFLASCDLVYYLLTPALQLVTGVASSRQSCSISSGTCPSFLLPLPYSCSFFPSGSSPGSSLCSTAGEDWAAPSWPSCSRCPT